MLLMLLPTLARGNTSSGSPVSTVEQTMIPLAAISHYQLRNVPLSINHQGLFVASTIAFNLQDGATLGAAIAEINNAISRIHMPASIHGDLSGTAQVFEQSLAKEPDRRRYSYRLHSSWCAL
jgi:multidrug efflux pump